MIGRDLLNRLRASDRGVAAVEFAIVVPVLLLIILGLSDLGYRAYVQSVLEGAVQKAARDATIEGSSSDTATAALDATVLTMVKRVARQATLTSVRKNYDNYGNISPEPFTDSKYGGVYDGICNHNEPFTDVNGNGSWDADPGVTGQGGASDVTKYIATLKYPVIFPLVKLFGGATIQTISASAILKNQPYKTQTTTTSSTGNCS